MIILLVILALVAIAATLHTLATDGYRRVPTRTGIVDRH